MSDVKVERHGAVMVTTIDRPESNNSITIESWRDLLLALQEAERDDSVRAIVTRASGKSFSVGADAADIGAFGECSLNELFAKEFVAKSGMHCGAGGQLEHLGIGRWVLAATSIEKPWIASVNGVAAGGGMALALMSHFRVGSTHSKFTTAFSKIGIGAEMGLSATLPALVGRQKAMELLISARIVKAQEAHDIGLLDTLVDADRLEAETMAFAEQIASYAPLATRSILRSCSRALHEDIRRQIEIEWRDQNALLASQDCREGVTALMEGRKPQFVGR